MRKLGLHIFSLLLACLMAFTAVHMGYIRGQASAVGQMELCTGMGPVTVGVDADGKPASLHYCPECALTLLAAVDVWQPETHTSYHHSIAFFTVETWTAHSAAAPQACARGPPVLA
jgi:hypothetical protein